MGSDNFLLDTTIVLYYLNGDDDLVTFLDDRNISISIIAEMELLSLPSITPMETVQTVNFISELTIYPLNEKVKNVAIALRKQYELKLAISIIAATAIVYKLQLITADIDFDVVKELDMLHYQPFKG